MTDHSDVGQGEDGMDSRDDQRYAPESQVPGETPAPDSTAPEGSAQAAAETQPAPAAAATATWPQTERQTAAGQAAPRLVRRREGKIIAGVCTGLGAYTGVDPVVWRIGFVVLGLTTGIGILAYIVAWLVMPMARAGEPAPVHDRERLHIGRWVGIAAVVLGVFIMFHNIWALRGGIFWGLLLLGLGVALWGREFAFPRTASAPGAPLPPSAPVPPDPARQSAAFAATEPFSTTPLATPSAPASSPRSDRHPRQDPATRHQRTPREPSMLGRLVVGAAALAVGVAVLLDNLGVMHATARMMLAVLVAIVGAGLLIGTRWGRARWLIFPGAVLAFALVLSSFVPVAIRGGFGDIVWAPTARSDVHMHYAHGAGNAVLALVNVPFDSKPTNINVQLSFGNLQIVLPEKVPVVVHASVQGGNLNLLGHRNNGFRVNDTVRDPGDGSFGLMTINARVNYGNIVVRRGTPGEVFNTGSHRVRVDIGPGRVNVDTGGTP